MFTQVESQRLFELFEKLVPCKGLYNRFSGYPKVRFHGSSLVYKVAFPAASQFISSQAHITSVSFGTVSYFR